MKKFYVTGLALLSVFALGAVMASAAFAESGWLVNGAVPTSEVASTSESVGTILLEDTKVPVLGTVDVTCTGVTGTGSVGPMSGETGNKWDLVSTVTFILADCKNGSNCTTVNGISMVNLPWLTEVVLNGEAFEDLILSSGAGEPGYRVECTTLGIKVADTCTKASSAVKLENVAAGVDAIFSEAETANCTTGGANSGKVTGTDLQLISGNTLTVS